WHARTRALFVTSGSAANLVLLQALLNAGRLRRGDRVGFSALTWATNVMPIIQLGLVPVALDCELDTLNVSPRILAAAAGLRCLFLTNVLGFCDDLPGIASFCRERGIVLLEDNCESLGSRIGGRLLGNYGLASTFSFFVGHHMSTIEGGMVCTDDEELADAATMVRAHGWDRNLPPERRRKWRDAHRVDDFYAKYTFFDLAFNARPTEINGFIGNLQLPFLPEIVERRRSNYGRFAAAARGNGGILPIRDGHMELVSNFAMPVVFRERERFERTRQAFTDARIEIRPIIAGDMTRQPFYRKYVSEPEPCPNSGLVHQQGFYFGNNPDLTEEELATIERALAA
ncbi:MAG TPA: DegT/DnrJ/EryC1/StrS family aminotransferase, partial [Elusimicrobiota bacterium]|nr:DegT/DnrJ/EryC1/StrS family aminotransferase [Elusimicrobiota bacterium]